MTTTMLPTPEVMPLYASVSVAHSVTVDHVPHIARDVVRRRKVERVLPDLLAAIAVAGFVGGVDRHQYQACFGGCHLQ